MMTTKSNAISPDAYIEPFKEMVAWEALWSKVEKPTFKKISQRLNKSLPSNYFELYNDELSSFSDLLKTYDLGKVHALIAGTSSYPEVLFNLENFLPVIYYKGDVEHLELPGVSIVGSRKASEQGRKIAKEIASEAVHNGFVVVSGLAEGIDTAAHTAAIKSKGKTIAVIGTPINEVYPKENEKLQKYIEKKHLLISHVPFLRYKQNKKRNFLINPKIFFPERNKTMAALTKATIIIEASDTSGTLIQARECLRMNRKLFIHSRILDDKNITWPRTYLKKKDVYVCDSFDEIQQIISTT